MPSLWGPEPQKFVGSGDCPCGWLRIAPSAGALPDTWLTAEPPYRADLLDVLTLPLPISQSPHLCLQSSWVEPAQPGSVPL